MNKTLTLSLLFLLSACAGDSKDDTDSSNTVTCGNGEEMPKELIGLWKRKIERNGSTGTDYWNITKDCKLLDYEIGDGNIMEEWTSGLEADIEYRFITQPEQTLYNFNEDKLTLTEEDATAYIYNNETNELITTWGIKSGGGEARYEINNSQLKFIVENNGTTFEIVYERVTES